jgi:hypothetical protein
MLTQNLCALVLGFVASAAAFETYPRYDPVSTYGKPDVSPVAKPLHSYNPRCNIAGLSYPKRSDPYDGYEFSQPLGVKPTGVFVAIGYQTYSCRGRGYKPIYIGASADLYDATCGVSRDVNHIHHLTKSLLYKPQYELNSYLNRELGPQAKKGRVYYKSKFTPVFQLRLAGQWVNEEVSLVKHYRAPYGACRGVPGKAWGALDWSLYKLAYPSSHAQLKYVQLAHTAGGKAPRYCPRSGRLTIRFAAEFWLYARVKATVKAPTHDYPKTAYPKTVYPKRKPVSYQPDEDLHA